MRVNKFKAARRSAFVLAAAWVGGCAAYGAFAKPRAYLTYSIRAPGTAPVRVLKCGLDDGSRVISTRHTETGSVGVTLCFKTLKAQKRRWWMEASYSPDVVRQMDAFEEGFRLPPQGAAEAERIHREERIEAWRFAATAAASGLAVGWLLVAVIGWLVRGVLNIPKGKDHRRMSSAGASANQRRMSDSKVVHENRVKRRSRRFD